MHSNAIFLCALDQRNLLLSCTFMVGLTGHRQWLTPATHQGYYSSGAALRQLTLLNPRGGNMRRL